MQNNVNHTDEVEKRLMAIRISENDVCSFFQSGEITLNGEKKCKNCKFAMLNKKENNYLTGLCKFKRY